MTPVLLLALGCRKEPDDPGVTPLPEPEALMVGAARVRMPVPLGIGTAGYGPFGVTAEPTPFAELFPGTNRIHRHPDFRAIAVSRGGPYVLVFLRVDAIGTFQQLRRAVVLELQERLGQDLDDALIIGATHTHSGPGRVVDAGGPFDFIADKFFPEFYEHMVDGMADAVEEALADLAPGRVGYGFADGSEGLHDRRCEDGLDYVNGTMPVLAIEQEGTLRALMLAYPVHGTSLDISDLTLSEDVSGGVESAVEDRLDGVMVQMFNAWGADMSPASPDVPLQTGAVLPEGYDQIASVGQAAADAVEGVLPELTWSDAPDIRGGTVRTRIDREVIGYDDGTFEYEYGAVYCAGTPEDCDPATTIDDLDSRCPFPFNEEFPAPMQTELSAGKIGDLQFVTFPGEPGTLLAEQVLADIRALGGSDDMMFLGYSQDYIGYSILEDDWWQGGYEASGALWGPRQGEYLAVEAVEAFGEIMDLGPAQPARPPVVAAFDVGSYAPYEAPDASTLGEVLVAPAAAYAPTDVVTFTVAGGDPWFGAPIATLRQGGSPVLRPSGAPVTSDGGAFWVDLVAVPSFASSPTADSRSFRWTFSMPARHPVVGAMPDLAGTYDVEVSLPVGEAGTLDVVVGPFDIAG